MGTEGGTLPAIVQHPCIFRASGYQLATQGIAAIARREQICLEQRLCKPAPLIIDQDFKPCVRPPETAVSFSLAVCVVVAPDGCDLVFD
jgi:hypothetical protein